MSLIKWNNPFLAKEIEKLKPTINIGNQKGFLDYGPSLTPPEPTTRSTGLSFFSSSTPSFSSAEDSNTVFENVPAQSADTKSNAVNEIDPLLPTEKLEIGSGLDNETLEDFTNLLSRLEESKMRQERKKRVEGRQDTMAKGIASMLGNF